MSNSNERPLGWTTVEEGQELVEAGLDPKTADMSYERLMDGQEIFYRAVCRPRVLDYEIRKWKPCWSLGALIPMLPLNIQTGDSFLDKYNLEFKLYSGYMVAYCIDQSHHPVVFTEKHGTLIEACVEILIWLLKNKLTWQTETKNG